MFLVVEYITRWAI